MPKKFYSKKTGFKTSVFDNIEAWEIGRRKFIKAVSVTGLVTQFSYLQSCTSTEEDSFPPNSHFNKVDTLTLHAVLEILFPDDGNGPSVREINAFEHILWVQDDITEDPSQLKYLRDGIVWTIEASQEIYGLDFLSLTSEEQDKLIAVVAKERWGKDWLSMLLTYIFEALIIDDLYKVNSEGKGWDWLEHKPGEPRPNQTNAYSKILEKIHD